MLSKIHGNEIVASRLKVNVFITIIILLLKSNITTLNYKA